MKILKYASILLISTLTATGVAQAQDMLEGQIQAFIVRGDVSLVNNSTGEFEPVSRGKIFGQGYTVQTGSGSSVLLLFSNGSSINLREESNLDINEFMQASYDESSGSFLTLQSDPSRSNTDMMLNYGALVGEVKSLRSDSDYEVRTPNGSAEIRGTTFLVSFDPVSGQTKITNLFGEVIGKIDGNALKIPEEHTYYIQGTLNGTIWTVDLATLRTADIDELEFARLNAPSNQPGVSSGGDSAPVTTTIPINIDSSAVTISPI